jgi:hypothetical protein
VRSVAVSAVGSGLGLLLLLVRFNVDGNDLDGLLWRGRRGLGLLDGRRRRGRRGSGLDLRLGLRLWFGLGLRLHFRLGFGFGLWLGWRRQRRPCDDGRRRRRWRWRPGDDGGYPSADDAIVGLRVLKIEALLLIVPGN